MKCKKITMIIIVFFIAVVISQLNGINADASALILTNDRINTEQILSLKNSIDDMVENLSNELLWYYVNWFTRESDFEISYDYQDRTHLMSLLYSRFSIHVNHENTEDSQFVFESSGKNEKRNIHMISMIAVTVYVAI